MTALYHFCVGNANCKPMYLVENIIIHHYDCIPNILHRCITIKNTEIE